MSIQEYNSPVAKNISKIIAEQGIKQRAVAKRASLTTQAMNDMLNGRRIIKPRDIPPIAIALGVSPNDLFNSLGQSTN